MDMKTGLGLQTCFNAYGPTWTPKGCKIMAFGLFLMVLGHYFTLWVQVLITHDPR